MGQKKHAVKTWNLSNLWEHTNFGMKVSHLAKFEYVETLIFCLALSDLQSSTMLPYSKTLKYLLHLSMQRGRVELFDLDK